MREAKQHMDRHALDRFERGVRWVDRLWIAFVITSLPPAGWGWTSGGRDHVAQPLALVLVPFLLINLDRMRRATIGRAKYLLLLTEVAGLGLIAGGLGIGYLRGSVLGWFVFLVGVPCYAGAMATWARDHGPGSGISERWRLATRWSAALAAVLIGLWGSVVIRGLANHTWSSIDISGPAGVFVGLITVGVLVPGTFVTVGLAASSTRRSLKLRPLRGVD